MKYLSTIFLFLCTITMKAQDELAINNQFQFVDGIYTSYEDFVQNTPSISLEKLLIKERGSRFFNKKRIKYIKQFNEELQEWKKINLSDIWGICIAGVPYIQYEIYRPSLINIGEINKPFYNNGDFTRIRIIGNICHFNIEDYIVSGSKHVLKPQNNSVSTKLISIQKVLKLATGDILDFTVENLKEFIKNDTALYAHFQADKARKHKLFIYLQTYNRRNPFYPLRNDNLAGN